MMDAAVTKNRIFGTRPCGDEMNGALDSTVRTRPKLMSFASCSSMTWGASSAEERCLRELAAQDLRIQSEHRA